MADITGTLSVCRRAGMLTCGTDEVKSSCRRKEARLVLMTSDFSERSKRDISDLCERLGINAVTISQSMDDIGYAVGKRFGVMSVSDKGFAEAILKKLKA